MSQVVSWFGSKSKFVNKIVQHFPKHETFVDVFGGSGVVLLNKPQSTIEVYNDIDQRLVRFFMVLQDSTKRKQLLDKIAYTPYSRELHKEYKEKLFNNPAELNEVDFALYFFVLSRQSFAGLANRVAGWSYSKSQSSASANKFQKGIRSIENFVHRFRYVQIENLDYADILTRYDGEKVLFYLDPPYVLSTRKRIDKRYYHEMTDEQHQKLVSVLLSIKGMMILSGYDHDIYRPLESAGWVKTQFIIRTNASRPKYDSDSNIREECLWISPNAICSQNRDLRTQVCNLTKRQLAAIEVANKRACLTQANIKQAIRELRLSKKRITHRAVAEMVGISRVQVTRAYSYLFK